MKRARVFEWCDCWPHRIPSHSVLTAVVSLPGQHCINSILVSNRHTPFVVPCWCVCRHYLNDNSSWLLLSSIFIHLFLLYLHRCGIKGNLVHRVLCHRVVYSLKDCVDVVQSRCRLFENEWLYSLDTTSLFIVHFCSVAVEAGATAAPWNGSFSWCCVLCELFTLKCQVNWSGLDNEINGNGNGKKGRWWWWDDGDDAVAPFFALFNSDYFSFFNSGAAIE